MKFVSDPEIKVKIDRMKSRVRWQQAVLKSRNINQTKLVIENERTDSSQFSFLVIGDSGCGSHLKHHPQRKIAEMMLRHRAETDFILHTGDVVYQVGSEEYYHNNFINPYREFLVGGDKPQQIKYDEMVFKMPFFPVLGNHDYYDLPLIFGVLAQATWLPRRFLKGQIDLDVGWHGSDCGDAYARAFIDYLQDIKGQTNLEKHLDTHYTGEHNGDRCLKYQPDKFTRIPNRYYTFSYGGIDFFALDSNTFNQPLSIPDTIEGSKKREQLLAKQSKLEDKQQKLNQEIDSLDPNNPEDAERIDDCYSKIEHIEESQRDIEKQLNQQHQETDWEQLEWLENSLVKSWQNEAVTGRVIFLHHPPYVTEATKWNQGQTLAIRDRLRQVFNNVVEKLETLPQDRSVVDLVLSGHAHCLEHLYTKDTGYGDSYINWLVCGGSGHSLRRQRKEGTVLYQDADIEDGEPIGQSHLYLGRKGHGKKKKRPYSFLRIDVQKGDRPIFKVTPHVAQWQQRQWDEYTFDSFTINSNQ